MRSGHRSGPQESEGTQPGNVPRPGSPGRDGRAAAGGHGNAARLPAGDWPSQFAQVLAETLAGSRPASQVTPWTTDRARTAIRRLGPLLAAGQRPRVRRLITSCPADDVVEVAAVVGFGPRARALAVRFERAAPQPASPGRPARPARWLCTAIEAA
ncbi:MAG TPA: Rv3235 family protein [Streptosporangiaceae bacterium]|nr:Rv3235 family protein [Streptosporangiaceae bacterium]